MLLQTCQAQWVLGKNDDRWIIADQENNLLLTFPKGLDEMQVGAIRRFAMDHEKLAYDEGVETGKQAMLAANSQRMKEMADKILVLEHMNGELAAKTARFFEDAVD